MASASTRAARSAIASASSSSAATVDEPGSARPSASIADDMVLAVYMPPQEPAPGHAWRSTSVSCASVIVPALHCPTASNALTIVRSCPCRRPGLMVPPYRKTDGTSSRAIAIMAPGMFLSQPPIASRPSMLWPFTTVSIESAITSRETSE